MLQIAILLLLLLAVLAWLSLAPWVPTRKKDLQRIDQSAQLQDGQTFLEMGSGTGRVCRYIAMKNPKSTVIGVELSWPFWLMSKALQVMFGPKNLKIQFGDVLKTNIADVDVFYTFARIESLNKQIKEKLLKEMPENSTLISYIFSFKDWPGKHEVLKDPANKATLHIYHSPSSS